MIFDKTGALANVKRHDYLPFGEELSAVVGLRSSSMGYGAADGVRQKFTGQERDTESGLDYFGARYFSAGQGRFTSVDPLGASAATVDPQSFNRYAYALNSPYKFTDPSGMISVMSSPGELWRDQGNSSGAFSAKNGTKYHEIAFHVRVVVTYGKPTLADFGKGHY
jgi:RHS repeat-associated protein